MNQALRAAATHKPAPRTIFDYLQDPRVAKGMSAVAGKYLTAERMMRLCITTVRKTPDLAKCDPLSVLGAMMTSCALQLEPNTPQQQAFLIPYKKWRKDGERWVADVDCQFQIGARGFVTLAYRSPVIASFEAHAICQRDTFKHMHGSRAFLEHSIALEDRGPVIGAYSFAKLKDGAELACVLPLSEIIKIRARSETWRALTKKVAEAENDKQRAEAEAKLAETPWEMWLEDMSSKSATKKHAKQLPLAPGDAMATAAEVDDAADAGVLDLSAMANVEHAVAVARGEEGAPTLEHDTSDRSFEAFGTTGNREAVHVDAGAAGAQQQEKAAGGKRGAQRKDAPAGDAGAPGGARKEKAPTYAELADRISKAKDRDEALLVLDEARSFVGPELLKDLGAHLDRAHPQA